MTLARTLFTLIALASFAASAEDRHFAANNCEIFVDRAAVIRGSHGSESLKFYIKVLNARLDAEVEEVGMRSRLTQTSHGGSARTSGWNNQSAQRFENSSDYFEISHFAGTNDMVTNVVEAAFYVKTRAGTYYWLNPAGGGNFILDDLGVRNVASRMNGSITHESPGPHRAAPTQETDPANPNPLRYYNPSNCR